MPVARSSRREWGHRQDYYALSLRAVVPVKITAEQRDALYDEILERLGGIDDIRMAASKGMFEMADRLAREYSDELRLVMDDLGWGGTVPVTRRSS